MRSFIRNVDCRLEASEQVFFLLLILFDCLLLLECLGMLFYTCFEVSMTSALLSGDLKTAFGVEISHEELQQPPITIAADSSIWSTPAVKVRV